MLGDVGGRTWKQSRFPTIFTSPPIFIHPLNIGNNSPFRKTQFIFLLSFIIILCNCCFSIILCMRLLMMDFFIMWFFMILGFW